MNYSCSRIVWFEPGDNGVGLYTSPTFFYIFESQTIKLYEYEIEKGVLYLEQRE